MRRVVAIVGALVLVVTRPAFAHRVDEYLQATTISVSQNRVHLEMRLAPGVKVVPIVLADIDADHDGVISDREQRTYAERVLGDLSLSVNGNQLPLRLTAWRYASVDELRRGQGEVQLEFDAEVQGGDGEWRLAFDNRHQRQISAYLVNGLVPKDPDIRINAQNRNYQQSSYEMNYARVAATEGSATFGTLLRWILLLGGVAALLAQLVGSRRTIARAASPR